MDEREWLTERFEQHRPHLRAVAYRMLGSVSETDDALQEAWLRIRDQDPGTVENMQAWLTTVVGRVCLNMLRSRKARREELSVHVPDPVVSLRGGWPGARGASGRVRQVWPCSWCSRRSLPPSDSRSSCTTCSACRSPTSPPRSTAPRRRPSSSPVAPAGACATRRSRTVTSRGRDASSTRSSPPRATATSMPS